MGSLPAATGRTMRFTGTTVLRLSGGKIVEEGYRQAGRFDYSVSRSVLYRRLVETISIAFSKRRDARR